MLDLWKVWAKASIAALLIETTQVSLMAGAERMDLLYSEGGGEFHSGVRVFLRHLA